MNTKLRQNTKYNIEKDFFKLIYYAVFQKNVENLRKNRTIKPKTTDILQGFSQKIY